MLGVSLLLVCLLSLHVSAQPFYVEHVHLIQSNILIVIYCYEIRIYYY